MEKTELQKRIDKLEECVSEIKDNHLTHLQNQSIQMGSDIDWLKKFQWLILATAITSLIVNLIK